MNVSYKELRQLISQTDLADRHRLQQRLGELKRLPDNSRNRAKQIAALAQRIETSVNSREKRCQQIPQQITIPDSLPIAEHADEIAELLSSNQVIIVAGETGSGKTTQLPKLCLKAGLGKCGLIGHTQPRRLAAMAVATRIADELQTRVGEGVGYQIRFNDKTSSSSYLKLMTDGILLSEIQRDKFLNKYEVLIVDEAHERSLNIDFILGYLKQLIVKRPELKVIVTSATIDVEKFAAHFENAPIVRVAGRTYPVTVKYLDPMESENQEDLDTVSHVVSAIEYIRNSPSSSDESGDILVFLSSEKDIRHTALALRKLHWRDVEVLPLYSRLRQADQNRIFAPHRGTRIVLATNIAETSITVPGIRYVIDTGLARMSRYSVSSKVQRLPIERISQASANQRAGRCGRVSAGTCLRLYSEQDFDSRPEFTEPEIKRTNLAAVILQMISLGLGEIRKFPFLESPDNKSVNDGYKLLVELGALTPSHTLTDIGRIMSRFPIDPRLSRMLIAADKRACLAEVLTIVSALSIQDPREISQENRQKARTKLAEFDDPRSDFLSLCKLWDEYERCRQQMSASQLRKFCKQYFLSFVRMREWREVHYQLYTLCHQSGFKINRDPGAYRQLHTALLSGCLNYVGQRAEDGKYLGSRNRKFGLFAQSVLSRKSPKWIVGSQIIETTSAFCPLAAEIEPEWIEEVAGHLSKKTWTEPHWSKKRQRVMGYEKVSLYGLVIIDRRLINYGEVDPEQSREIFIHDALADQQLDVNLDFYQHNQNLLAELEEQEKKVRKQSYFLDHRQLELFYDEKIPASVNDRESLLRWYNKAKLKDPEVLKLHLSDLLSDDKASLVVQEFPDRTTIQRNPLTVNYQFIPGNPRDGATIEVPLPLLGQVKQRDIDWSVPGQVKERSVHLLKALPKSIRKQLIPLGPFVDEALQSVNFQTAQIELRDLLVDRARKLRGVVLDPESFDQAVIPEYLKVKIAIVSDDNEELAQGADLASLQRQFASNSKYVESTETEISHAVERRGLQDWDFDELPASVETGDDLRLIRYPALVDRDSAVDVTLVTELSDAHALSSRGLMRLAMLRTGQQGKELSKLFKNWKQESGLQILPLLSGQEQETYFIQGLYCSCFRTRIEQPTCKKDFEKNLQLHRSDLYQTATEVLKSLRTSAAFMLQINQSLGAMEFQDADYLREDVESQLAGLFGEKYLLCVEAEQIRQYPRFLRAIQQRIEKFAENRDRDHESYKLVVRHWNQLLQRKAVQPAGLNASIEFQPGLKNYRWGIEEFRVSMFAQQLRTQYPISDQRLVKLWHNIVDI